jgi:hypothetical protein
MKSTELLFDLLIQDKEKTKPPFIVQFNIKHLENLNACSYGFVVLSSEHRVLPLRLKKERKHGV